MRLCTEIFWTKGTRMIADDDVVQDNAPPPPAPNLQWEKKKKTGAKKGVGYCCRNHACLSSVDTDARSAGLGCKHSRLSVPLASRTTRADRGSMVRADGLARWAGPAGAGARAPAVCARTLRSTTTAASGTGRSPRRSPS